MPKGDKYLGFTNYLKAQHAKGNDRLTLSFDEIAHAQGFPLNHTQRTYFWANDRTQSYSHGWLNAGYVVAYFNQSAQQITFQYDPDRVKELVDKNLSEGHQNRLRRTAKVEKSLVFSSTALGLLPITNNSIEHIEHLVLNDPGYGTDIETIGSVLRRFPENTDPDIVAMKICLIDVTNSTHIGVQRQKITLHELTKLITQIPDFDGRLASGDSELVNLIARSNGNINLFSFASKYCTYHNVEVYQRDDYSIFDSVIAKTLPRYVRGLNPSTVNGWRSSFNYAAYKDCIGKLLDACGIDIPFRRRKFDHFLWYTNK